MLQFSFRYFVLLLLLLVGACATQRPPTLIPFDDGEYWVLGNDLVYTLRDSGQKIVVPRGFVTDFASVPRIFWTFFPRHGEYTRAAIVHDFLYWQQRCTRQQADELFDIVMEDSEVDSASRFTIYAAVRMWGDDAWEENTNAKKDGYIRIIPERYLNFPVKTRWTDYREFLRNMLVENGRGEEFPSSAPPPYCLALEGKEQETEQAEPATPQLNEEQEKQEQEKETPETDEQPEPENQPVPESAIGA